MQKQAFAITEAAASRIQNMMQAQNLANKILLVSIKTKGCSGLSYHMEFTDAPPAFAESVSAHGVTVAIDPKASMFLFGTVMDYEESALQSGFQFKNPNETGRCGCGESFTVNPDITQQ